MKHLELDDETKELLGYIDQTPEEHKLDEEFKQMALDEPRTLKISAAGAPMDVNIVIGGNKKPLVPKQNVKKPEKSVKLMNKKLEEFKSKFK